MALPAPFSRRDARDARPHLVKEDIDVLRHLDGEFVRSVELCDEAREAVAAERVSLQALSVVGLDEAGDEFRLVQVSPDVAHVEPSFCEEKARGDRLLGVAARSYPGSESYSVVRAGAPKDDHTVSRALLSRWPTTASGPRSRLSLAASLCGEHATPNVLTCITTC